MYTYKIVDSFGELPKNLTDDIYQVRGSGRIRYPIYHMYRTIANMKSIGLYVYCFRFELAMGQHRITFFTNPDAYNKWAKEEDKILANGETKVDSIHEGLCRLDSIEFWLGTVHPKRDSWRCIRIDLNEGDDKMWVFEQPMACWEWMFGLERWDRNFVMVCFPPNRRSSRSHRPLELLTYDKLGVPRTRTGSVTK